MGQRVGFYLTDVEIKNLKKLSEKTDLTVSEIIRRSIDDYLEKYGMTEREEVKWGGQGKSKKKGR
jgi:hypothetical protein